MVTILIDGKVIDCFDRLITAFRNWDPFFRRAEIEWRQANSDSNGHFGRSW